MTTDKNSTPEILDLNERKSQSNAGHAFPVIFIVIVLALAGWNYRQEIERFIEQPSSTIKTTVDATPLSNKFLYISNKIDALALRIETLEQANKEQATPNTSAPTSNTNTARLEGEVIALTQAVSALQEQLKKTNESIIAGQKSSFIALINSLETLSRTGQSFTSEFIFLRQASINNPALTETMSKLEPIATTGAPNLDALKKTFDIKSSAANVALLKAAATTWYERLWIEIQQLVTIRTLHPKSGETSVMAAIAGDLEQKKLGDAVDKAKNLPEVGRIFLADWIKQAEARVALDTILIELSRLSSD